MISAYTTKHLLIISLQYITTLNLHVIRIAQDEMTIKKLTD